MTKSEYLTVESRKCRRLADLIGDKSARFELLALAAEYEAEVVRIEHASSVR